MNIAIIGAGAIGSVVAAYLTKAGERVVLLARPEQAQAIEHNGLQVRGTRGEERIQIAVRPELDQQHYDLVIFTVKTQDIEDVCRANRQSLQGSCILSSQNGVQADNILRQYFPAQNIYSSIVMFGATYTSPGEVVFNFDGDWIIGKPFGPRDEKLDTIAGVLKKGFNIVAADDIVGMKWLKLFVNFNNCIPALTGKSMQETFADMDLCRLSILLLKEGVGILQKNGVRLVSLPQFPAERVYGMANMPLDQAAGIINKTLTTLSKEPLYGSILQSIMRGRASEIDYINGQVVRMARVPAQEAVLNAKIVEMVHQVEGRKKYFSVEEIKAAFELNRERA
ncbi:MAG: 2-dehydropantoate 2-reductase [Candidatus Omnitrophica bacterium]|nr:2-dehydropantoate 2-reductase [Candidatus Omnitrophota bacterium]